jgi:hypothetical protein
MSATVDDLRPNLTLMELADHLGCHPDTIRCWCREPFKPGGVGIPAWCWDTGIFRGTRWTWGEF